MNDLFYESNENERLKGYKKDKEYFCCLFCDFKTEEGIIYSEDDELMTAEKKMKNHIVSHGGVFNELVRLDKKINGFSEHQSRILEMFYQGMTDHEVQEKMNVGSVSTIRNHRHLLKEKEKQAKVMTTIMSLLSEKMESKAMVKPHKTATMVDNRYDVSLDEAYDIINKYFEDGKLKTFNMKEKNKLIVLREIMKKFEYGKKYSAKEIDTILKEVYEDDYVLIRRYLIEYGFMDRTRDTKFYWVKDKVKSDDKVSKKKENRNKRKEMINKKFFSDDSEIISGVYQIKNLMNSKIYIGSGRNIKKLDGLMFQLRTNSFINKSLQEDWNEYGEDNFEISILESFIEEGDSKSNSKKVTTMKRRWINKLNPYGDNGYHRK